MTNPVSLIPSAQMPYASVSITEPDGTPTLSFHRFLEGVWQRTGGASGVSGTDVAQVAKTALTIAQTASTEATAAQSAASAAQTTANTALADAVAAASAASAAQTTASTALTGGLTRANNLSDVNSASASRSNLGLNTLPLTFSFDICSAGLKRGIPLTRTLTLPASFVGSAIWWGIAGTVDAVFNVGYSNSQSSFVNPIGTITLINHGTGTVLSIQAARTLVAGQTLVVSCPSVPDATLAQVSFTFPMILV